MRKQSTRHWASLARRSKAFRPEEFAARGSSFRFGRDPRGFDILPDLPSVDFDPAWERLVQVAIDATTGLKANFTSRDDLIAAKLASGKPQDLADVDAIKRAVESTGA